VPGLGLRPPAAGHWAGGAWEGARGATHAPRGSAPGFQSRAREQARAASAGRGACGAGTEAATQEFPRLPARRAACLAAALLPARLQHAALLTDGPCLCEQLPDQLLGDLRQAMGVRACVRCCERHRDAWRPRPRRAGAAPLRRAGAPPLRGRAAAAQPRPLHRPAGPGCPRRWSHPDCGRGRAGRSGSPPRRGRCGRLPFPTWPPSRSSAGGGQAASGGPAPTLDAAAAPRAAAADHELVAVVWCAGGGAGRMERGEDAGVMQAGRIGHVSRARSRRQGELQVTSGYNSFTRFAGVMGRQGLEATQRDLIIISSSIKSRLLM
jgi:hypothetical protein